MITLTKSFDDTMEQLKKLGVHIQPVRLSVVKARLSSAVGSLSNQLTDFMEPITGFLLLAEGNDLEVINQDALAWLLSGPQTLIDSFVESSSLALLGKINRQLPDLKNNLPLELSFNQKIINGMEYFTKAFEQAQQVKSVELKFTTFQDFKDHPVASLTSKQEELFLNGLLQLTDLRALLPLIHLFSSRKAKHSSEKGVQDSELDWVNWSFEHTNFRGKVLFKSALPDSQLFKQEFHKLQGNVDYETNTLLTFPCYNRGLFIIGLLTMPKNKVREILEKQNLFSLIGLLQSLKADEFAQLDASRCDELQLQIRGVLADLLYMMKNSSRDLNINNLMPLRDTLTQKENADYFCYQVATMPESDTVGRDAILSGILYVHVKGETKIEFTLRDENKELVSYSMSQEAIDSLLAQADPNGGADWPPSLERLQACQTTILRFIAKKTKHDNFMPLLHEEALARVTHAENGRLDQQKDAIIDRLRARVLGVPDTRVSDTFRNGADESVTDDVFDDVFIERAKSEGRQAAAAHTSSAASSSSPNAEANIKERIEQEKKAIIARLRAEVLGAQNKQAKVEALIDSLYDEPFQSDGEDITLKNGEKVFLSNRARHAGITASLFEDVAGFSQFMRQAVREIRMAAVAPQNAEEKVKAEKEYISQKNAIIVKLRTQVLDAEDIKAEAEELISYLFESVGAGVEGMFRDGKQSFLPHRQDRVGIHAFLFESAADYKAFIEQIKSELRQAAAVHTSSAASSSSPNAEVNVKAEKERIELEKKAIIARLRAEVLGVQNKQAKAEALIDSLYDEPFYRNGENITLKNGEKVFLSNRALHVGITASLFEDAAGFDQFMQQVVREIRMAAVALQNAEEKVKAEKEYISQKNAIIAKLRTQVLDAEDIKAEAEELICYLFESVGAGVEGMFRDGKQSFLPRRQDRVGIHAFLFESAADHKAFIEQIKSELRQAAAAHTSSAASSSSPNAESNVKAEKERLDQEKNAIIARLRAEVLGVQNKPGKAEALIHELFYEPFQGEDSTLKNGATVFLSDSALHAGINASLFGDTIEYIEFMGRAESELRSAAAAHTSSTAPPAARASSSYASFFSSAPEELGLTLLKGLNLKRADQIQSAVLGRDNSDSELYVIKIKFANIDDARLFFAAVETVTTNIPPVTITSNNEVILGQECCKALFSNLNVDHKKILQNLIPESQSDTKFIPR